MDATHAAVLIVWFITMSAIVAGLVYYIYRAIKQRAAVAPGWSFDRDEQPFLFWLQVCVVGWFALKLLADMAFGLLKVAQLI